MNHVDLFSGIGGFALAAKWAGFTTVQFVEIDTYCQRVLRKNFPGVDIHDDIKSFRGERFRGTCDLLTGGFPCQPFSVAGKQLGAEDDRALWPEMYRVITEIRPNWIVGENVAGLLPKVEFDHCISDLEKAGYEVGVFVIPACAVEAPHRRDRVWIVANSESGKSGGVRESGAFPYAGIGTVGVANSERLEDKRNILDLPQEFFSLERADWRQVEPMLCGGIHGIPHRVDRLRGLGNAIVPQVAFHILQAIAEQIRGE